MWRPPGPKENHPIIDEALDVLGRTDYKVNAVSLDIRGGVQIGRLQRSPWDLQLYGKLGAEGVVPPAYTALGVVF